MAEIQKEFCCQNIINLCNYIIIRSETDKDFVTRLLKNLKIEVESLTQVRKMLEMNSSYQKETKNV